MAAAPFCGLLGTLRDAAALLEPDKELPTLRAFAELAMEFQPVAAEAPNGALTVSDSRASYVVTPQSSLQPSDTQQNLQRPAADPTAVHGLTCGIDPPDKHVAAHASRSRLTLIWLRAKKS